MVISLGFGGLGLYWIARNPKKSEQRLYLDGDPAARIPRRRLRVFLAFALLAALLIGYQVFFFPAK